MLDSPPALTGPAEVTITATMAVYGHRDDALVGYG